MRPWQKIRRKLRSSLSEEAEETKRVRNYLTLIDRIRNPGLKEVSCGESEEAS